MSGWDATSQRWPRMRRATSTEAPRGDGGRWTVSDVLALLVAFAVRWELGVAFLALKMWHQASGRRISTLSFAREKWDSAVETARSLSVTARLPASFNLGSRPSGSPAFDRWRKDELARISAERAKLAEAEEDFARYRDELLGARDREQFERFMHGRDDRR